MNVNSIILTVCEVFISVLLVYGYLNENKIIEFEQDIKRIIKGNYKRIKRGLKNEIL